MDLKDNLHYTRSVDRYIQRLSSGPVFRVINNHATVNHFSHTVAFTAFAVKDDPVRISL